MAKETRPAMPFYGKDWYDDINVQEMDYAEQGVYLRLCWLCWSEGAIPDNGERVARILKVPDPPGFVQKTFGRLRACFDAVDGMLIHPKIEKIRAELDDFRKARAEAGRKGAASRWHSHDFANGKPYGKVWPASPSSSSSPFAKEEQNTSAPQSGARMGDSSFISTHGSPFSKANKPTAEQTAWFSQFWESYPVKKSRKRALDVFCECVQTETRFSEVMAALNVQATEMATLDPRHCPYAGNWLAGERWADEPSKPVTIPKIENW